MAKNVDWTRTGERAAPQIFWDGRLGQMAVEFEKSKTDLGSGCGRPRSDLLNFSRQKAQKIFSFVSFMFFYGNQKTATMLVLVSAFRFLVRAS